MYLAEHISIKRYRHAIWIVPEYVPSKSRYHGFSHKWDAEILSLRSESAEIKSRLNAKEVVEQTENSLHLLFGLLAVISFCFHAIKKPDDQTLNEDFIRTVEGLPGVGDKFGNESVVLPAAGCGTVLAEVVHFSSDSDKGSPGFR